jgi:hypothetical protein
MVIDMNDARLETIEQIREFLAGTADVTFAIPTEEAALHSFTATVLKRFQYFNLTKGERGSLFAYYWTTGDTMNGTKLAEAVCPVARVTIHS